MADWNPNSTLVKGLEWLPSPSLSGAVVLDSTSKIATMSWRQTASLDIGTVRIAVGDIATRGGVYAVEIYDEENAVPAGGFETLIARPNEDVSGTGTGAGSWREDDGSTTSTIFDQIDEATLDTTDYIYTRAVGTYVANGIYTFRHNTQSLTLTGKRVLEARQVLWARSNVNPPAGQFSWGFQGGGSDWAGGTVLPPYNKWTQYQTLWPFHPVTGKPWTIAEVNALDNLDPSFVRFVGATGRIDVAQHFWQFYLCTENRLAVGTLDDRASGLTPNAYNTVTLTTPTAGTWTKDGSTRHLVTVRRVSAVGQLAIPTIDAGDQEANPARGFAPVVNTIYGYIESMGDPIPRIFGAIVRDTAGPTDHVDSQPYYETEEASVYSGSDAEMEFSDAAAANYSIVAFTLKKNDAMGDLEVSIHRRSDDVQMGGTATVSELLVDIDDVVAVTAMGGGWYRVVVRLPTVAGLAVGTQYYVRWRSLSSSGSGTDRWSIAGLDTTDVGNTATVGGTTDRARINGVEADRFDIPVMVSQAPDPPANFTAAADTVSVDPSLCGVDEVGVVVLEHDATALGGLFERYEIEETVDGGTTWSAIKLVRNETVTDLVWYGTPRNTTVQYRVRVVRTDGATSDWSVSATLTVPSICAEMIFTSDEEPTLTIALDRRPEITFRFLDADQVVYTPIYMRDHQIASSPLETMGVEANLTSAIGVDDRPAPGGGIGLAAFAALRALSRAPVPEVIVLDSYGTRLFASLVVPEGVQMGGPDRYVATIQATEISPTPTPTIHD